MFSALRQGNIVYILDKSNKLTLKTGQVISNSGANVPYNIAPQQVINLAIDINGETLKIIIAKNTIKISAIFVPSKNPTTFLMLE